jgi:DNA-directed RNA polymerase specialized sigma24 family protein
MDQNSPLEALEEKRIYEAIAAAVNELPKDLRDVFKGNVLEGKTFKQLVEEKRHSIGYFTGQEKRAVAKLRESLNREGIVPETIPD